MDFNKTEFYGSYGFFSQIPASDEKPEIVFSGRSNVGKSTLINKLVNRKALARVSSVPGKTATINFYSCEDIFLVDLPGYGYARVSDSEKQKWSKLIWKYLTSERDIALVVQLIDMRHPPTQEDLSMIDFMIESETPFIIVFTKADKLSSKERTERLNGFSEEIPDFEQITAIPFSSQTGEGVAQLKAAILSALGQD